MNERINNLIDQSGFGSYAEISDTYVVHKNDLVEFAELIVKECAGVCEDYRGTEWGKIAESIGDRIREQLGVE